MLAVQSEQAPAAYQSWKQGEIVEAEMNTVAEGIATGVGYELAQGIMRDLLDDFLLVSDEEIHRAIGTLVDKAHTLAEGAGATALAGAIKERESQLDILVNNAGAAWGAPLEGFPESGWDKVMDINVKSPFFLTQALLPLLEKSASKEDPARIISIGSVDGLNVNRDRKSVV